MTENLVNETLYSEYSNLIPNNIKFYITKLRDFENSNFYDIIDEKAFSSKNVCDNNFEKQIYYNTMLNDITNSYLPVINKYPILLQNFNNIINYLKKKI